MGLFNRIFVTATATAWAAAWAGIMFLMWSPGRGVDFDHTRLRAIFDITVSGSDRILGTLIAALAVAAALALVALELRPRRRREPVAGRLEDAAAREQRYRELDRRLDELQRRVEQREAAAARAASSGGPAPAFDAPTRPGRWLFGRK